MNGALPQVLRETFPEAEIVCGEAFPYFREHLESLGFGVVNWNEDWGDMKFDLVIGNPPYTDSTVGNIPIYDEFVKNSVAMSNSTVALVIPSSATTSDERNGCAVREFISRSQTKLIKFLDPYAFEGAVVNTLYFVLDKGYNGETKIESSSGSYSQKLTAGDYVFRDKHLANILEKCQTSSATASWIKFNRIEQTTESSKLKTVTKISKNELVYEDTDQADNYVGQHRVCTSFLPNSPNHLDVVAYVGPDIAVKKGYTVCCMPTEKSAKNLVAYLKTAFCRAIHNETKTSRSLRSPQLKFIPKVDLDVCWTDDMLYKHFALSKEEVSYIEGKIQ